MIQCGSLVLRALSRTEALFDTACRTMLYLQLILQIQSQSTKSSNFLNKPHQIISFIRQALSSSIHILPKPSEPRLQTERGLRMEDLRIVPESDDALSEEADSDDDEATETE